MEHLEIDGVGPAKAHDVRLVSRRDLHIGGAGDDIVFLIASYRRARSLLRLWVNLATRRRASAKSPVRARPSVAIQVTGAQLKGRSHCMPEAAALMARPSDCSKRSRWRAIAVACAGLAAPAQRRRWTACSR